MIHGLTFYAGIGWLTLLLGVCVVQVVRAPSPMARVVAIDLLVLVLIGLLALVAGEDARPYALDAALGLALLSFVSTIAFARYLGDRRPFG